MAMVNANGELRDHTDRPVYCINADPRKHFMGFIQGDKQALDTDRNWVTDNVIKFLRNMYHTTTLGTYIFSEVDIDTVKIDPKTNRAIHTAEDASKKWLNIDSIKPCKINDPTPVNKNLYISCHGYTTGDGIEVSGSPQTNWWWEDAKTNYSNSIALPKLKKLNKNKKLQTSNMVFIEACYVYNHFAAELSTYGPDFVVANNMAVPQNSVSEWYFSYICWAFFKYPKLNINDVLTKASNQFDNDLSSSNPPGGLTENPDPFPSPGAHYGLYWNMNHYQVRGNKQGTFVHLY